MLLALGEPLFDGDYCDHHAGPDAEGPCVHHDGCTLRTLRGTLEGWIRRTLNQITLADLLAERGPHRRPAARAAAGRGVEPEETLITLQVAERGGGVSAPEFSAKHQGADAPLSPTSNRPKR